MTKRLIFIMTLLLALPLGRAGSGCLWALPIECTGATQIVNGNDTLLIFNGPIDIRSKWGEVDWYNIETGEVETNIETQYNLDEGGYYIKKGSMTSAPFYVFHYTEPEIQSLTVVPDCDATILLLEGDTKPFRYVRPDQTAVSYARACSINYNALAWDTEAWADSAVQVESILQSRYSLPAMYGATPITLCYDAAIRSAFNLDSACLEIVLTEDMVQAVKHELTSLATTRGEEGEKTNERNRPTSQKLIAGNTYSGPLEVAFYSNPTPAAQFYSWSIYKSTDRIVTRSDKDIRYSFLEPGTYRVVCYVSNDYCTSDSTEMSVTVAESYLAVPNVFTPNGDGKNDEFRVAYRSLREFHIWVYNRWGKLIYESTDPARGWDGTINGKPAAVGAYFYVIRALGTDAPKNAAYIGLKATYTKMKLNGDKAINGVYQLSGDINLLR